MFPYFWSVDVKFCACHVLPVCLHPKRLLLSYLFFMTHTRLNVLNLTIPNSHPSLPAEVLNTLQGLLRPSRHILIVILNSFCIYCIHSLGCYLIPPSLQLFWCIGSPARFAWKRKALLFFRFLHPYSPTS